MRCRRVARGCNAILERSALFKHVIFAAAVLAAATFAFPKTGLAAGVTVSGQVVDATTGLALAGVKVQSVGPTSAHTETGLDGRFKLDDLAPGTYSLQLALAGYQTTLSEEFNVGTGFSLPLTLAMQRQAGSTSLRVLGRTTVTATRTLQKTSVIYQQVTGDTLLRQGITRAGDAIRRLPAVDNSSSDTATFGDDVTLNIRGIGTLETVSLLDGHPIGLGIAGIDSEISPSYGLRSVSVIYGAGGGDLYGVDAIGGVVDYQTLEPTHDQSVNYTQGWGTFDRLSSILQATGPIGGRWGYALALGSSSIDGPVKHSVLYEPGAAYDISATDPAVIAANTYFVDSNIANRGLLFKLRYGIGTNTHITAVATGNYWYDNKTGNGDNDFLPMDTALAIANQKLNSYTPPNNPAPFNALNPQNCPAGTFLATNAQNGVNGYGLDGVTPDGGVSCTTPAQWAAENTGYQGGGPAWQAFTLHDYQMRFDTTMGRNTININGFSDLYTQTYDRTWGLPFILVPPAVPAGPGCNPACTLTSNPGWHNIWLSNAGVVASDSMVWDNDELGIGAYYDNDASLFTSNGSFNPSPVAHETSVFLRNALHPLNSPLTTYVSAYFKHSTVTNTSFVDPRLAFVLNQGDNVYRLAVGQISTQPALTDTAGPFVVGTVNALNGNIQCNALNSVGSGGNPNLKPERATDAEFSVGHRFALDSTIQLSLYSEGVFNQLYTQDIPVQNFAPGFFGTSGYLASGSPIVPFATAVASFCGISQAQALPLLSVSGTVNIGQGLAEGFEINGRQRLSQRFYIDYDYATNSSVPISVPLSILAGNFSLIPNGQLPGIPLHKYNFSFDYTFGHGIEARTDTYFIDANNPKNLPAYNYTDVSLSAPTGKFGTISAIVGNVFQQFADYRGLIGEGFPRALNPAFAAQENFAPLLGNQATERFGLPFRTVQFLYTLKVK